jgi:hypothetical protein
VVEEEALGKQADDLYAKLQGELEGKSADDNLREEPIQPERTGRVEQLVQAVPPGREEPVGLQPGEPVRGGVLPEELGRLQRLVEGRVSPEEAWQYQPLADRLQGIVVVGCSWQSDNAKECYRQKNETAEDLSE